MNANDVISNNNFMQHIISAKKQQEYVANIVITDKKYKDNGETENYYIGNGHTEDYYGRADRIVIGIKQIDETQPLTYGDLTTTLIALYHEVGHARQVNYEFKKKSDLSTVLALNHYARKCSSVYYDVNNLDEGNYSTHTSEIAAQYVGLNMAYTYLSEHLDEKSANQLICNYVNNEVASNFIPVDKNNPYTNVQDIFNKYNDVFNESIYKHREFKPNKHVDDVYNRFGNNLTTLQLQAPTTSGLRQDAILAGIYIEKSSEKEYFDTGIAEALSNISFNDIKKPITGNKHVPAVSRINLNGLLPNFEPEKESDDYEYK